jgi:hypothetical protein
VHTAHVHESEIKSGDDIYAWMEQHHDAADHVLCVVSDDYLKAPYSTLERNAALWRAAATRPGFVLLVVVKPCRLPTLSDHIRRCELFGVPEEAACVRFRELRRGHRATRSLRSRRRANDRPRCDDGPASLSNHKSSTCAVITRSSQSLRMFKWAAVNMRRGVSKQMSKSA